MVTAQVCNLVSDKLISELENKKILNINENIAVLCSDKHLIGESLQKLGYKVRIFHRYVYFEHEFTHENYKPKIIINLWSDRDTWKVFEILPKHTKFINLYSPLFRTSLDHELNKKFLKNFIGTSEVHSELGSSNIPWDNKAFIYDFTQLRKD